MHHSFLLFAAAYVFSTGCQAEDPSPLPSATLDMDSKAALERSADTSLSSAPVGEEVVLAAEAPVVTPYLGADSNVSAVTTELSDALDARDDDRIQDAISLLEEQGGEGAILAIISVITRSTDPENKIEALDSLAFLANNGDVSSGLEQALGDSSGDVRIEAADLIVELELIELLPTLRTRGYQESDPEVGNAIEEAIRELESTKEDERT